MQHAKQFGIRLATILFATGLVGAASVIGCGTSVEIGGGGSGNSGNSGGGGNGGSASSSGNGSTSGAPMCSFGGVPQRQCFTLDQIENQINNPFPGGPIDLDGGTDAAPDGGGVMLTECPEPSIVRDGCCNPGVSGPEIEGELCCYYFCTGACCGRAFTIEGQARVAETMSREDWCGNDSTTPNDVDDVTRLALAEAWRRDAQMEHASIASFARFTLELLALGTPADLISASQSASLDEVQHARLCFALASRFSGRAIGPGPLDMTHALRESSLAECAGWTVIEGCIGETIAALTARAQLDVAEDNEARRALLQIAEDEERHAALAWRFVAWALSTGGVSVRASVQQAFAEGMQQVRAHRNAEMPGIDESLWHRFGRLTGSEMDKVAEQALNEAILPNVAILLATPAHQTAMSSNTSVYT
ncbi:MAG TPA: ferritin-like domain-containing protein [Polyangium sp.]|nr:ferritin-like domain-containing protein [Polyangium sp.]